MKIKKPNQPPYSTKLPDYYNYSDFYVGAVLSLNSFLFELYDADEYCYNFMEKNVNIFPYSSLPNVKNKLKNIVQSNGSGSSLANLEAQFKQYDSSNSGLLDFNAFVNSIESITSIYFLFVFLC
jgi:hypothetical protein